MDISECLLNIFPRHLKIAGTLLSLIWAVVSPLFITKKALYEIPSNNGSIMISIQLHLDQNDVQTFNAMLLLLKLSRFEPHSLSVPYGTISISGTLRLNSMIRRQRQFRQLFTYSFRESEHTKHFPERGA